MMRRLLIVDDEENVLLGMQRCLRLAGYEVDCARERSEAEALLDRHAYDCTVVDLCLVRPHCAEGLHVVAHARARSPATRVVILTAYGSPSVETVARALKVDAFLRKPTSMAELREVVDGLGRSEA